MQTNSCENTIEILKAEAANMIVEKARHRGSRLEQYFSGREAGILFALDHIERHKEV